MPTPLYSVDTWDPDLCRFTPQDGLTVPSQDVPITTLRRVLKELRGMGYTCHRRRDKRGCYDDNDASVSVERTN